MTGARPERALDALREQLRNVVACVTAQPVIIERGRADSNTGRILFAPVGDTARLRTVNRWRSLRFSIRHEFELRPATSDVRQLETATTAYSHVLRDTERNEILAYHWHPLGLSSVKHPVLHLSNQFRPIELGRNQAPLPLAELHLATGVVPLAHLVRMLIEEFDVEPLREDWDAALTIS